MKYKLKSKKSLLKRIKIISKFKIKHKCSNKNHILTKKTKKRKKRLLKLKFFNKKNIFIIRKLLLF
ncbi:MAG: 50S ribosomal protein L35 [Candidatus Shikimatogenerans sp. AspAUS03]|uniref:Large ribosomal subunit protein bL35 n=1 Tax=Candidatus Shikimatogenerans sp. AspAUS03 TaxID=3158563 RepID=A0AAU7QU67_9FLAO